MTKRFVAHRPKPAPIDPAGAAGARPEDPKSGRAGPNSAKPPGPDGCRPKEIGGPSGPEPTRYGDWERKGICVDF
jgi:homeobox protein ESX1